MANDIGHGKAREAFVSPTLPLLLIDEVDNADFVFLDGLLHELDRWAFDLYETDERVTARERPIVVITTNNQENRSTARSTCSSRCAKRRG